MQRQRQTKASHSVDSLGVHIFYACRDAIVQFVGTVADKPEKSVGARRYTGARLDERGAKFHKIRRCRRKSSGGKIPFRLRDLDHSVRREAASRDKSQFQDLPREFLEASTKIRPQQVYAFRPRARTHWLRPHSYQGKLRRLFLADRTFAQGKHLAWRELRQQPECDYELKPRPATRRANRRQPFHFGGHKRQQHPHPARRQLAEPAGVRQGFHQDLQLQVCAYCW